MKPKKSLHIAHYYGGKGGVTDVPIANTEGYKEKYILLYLASKFVELEQLSKIVKVQSAKVPAVWKEAPFKAGEDDGPPEDGPFLYQGFLICNKRLTRRIEKFGVMGNAFRINQDLL